MNNEQIEKILRNPPVIKTPGGLLEKLTEDIQLPRAQRERTEWVMPTPWFKRWMPALSFAIVFLGCLVALAVQTNMLSGLRSGNDKLRAGQGNLDTLRAQNIEVQRLRNENQELERLRKDNLEMKKLLKEVAQLKGQVQGLDQVRTENQQLKSAVAARLSVADGMGQTSPAPNPDEESVRCTSNMKQIGLAFRIWEGDNNDKVPDDFISITNELNTWMILKCPSDKARVMTGWEDVKAGNISYKRVSSGPGVTTDRPDIVLLECPIHGHVLLMDGSVQKGVPEVRQRLKVADGITYYEGYNQRGH